MIKVLIVDDSTFMRHWLVDVLANVEGIDVVGTAKNGLDALKKIQTLNPDVVTLDVEMPIMDGLQTLEQIMQVCPLPVIMLSSWTKEGATITLEAMEKGAFDFIPKPEFGEDLDSWKKQFIAKIRMACEANLHSLIKGQPQTPTLPEKIRVSHSEKEKTIVVIGTSTGGPRALEEVIGKLPAQFPAPVVVIQHMPPRFTGLLAERLNRLSTLPVKEAEQGEILQNGHVYIAPGGYHLQIEKKCGRLSSRLTLDPPLKGLRPAFDYLLQSLTNVTDYRKVVVFLTGMGSDGASSLVELKKTGPVYTIAEAKETAVIFGMPKAAIQTGYVDEVARLERIADLIHKKVCLGWT